MLCLPIKKEQNQEVGAIHIHKLGKTKLIKHKQIYNDFSQGSGVNKEKPSSKNNLVS